MELRLGKMTQRDLSAWFGYKTPDGFSRANPKTKEKKMAILQKCADFHYENKTLYIDKIYISEFCKAYDKIEQEFPKEWGHFIDNNQQLDLVKKNNKIDTCARVGNVIWKKNPDVQAQIKNSTSIMYTNQIKVKWYGHNYLDDHGIKGRSQSVLLNQKGMPLNDEELAIISKCRQKAYEGVSELIAELDEDYYQGLMSKQERDKAVGELETKNQYDNYVELVIQELGYYPSKQTQLIDEQYFEN